MYAGLSTIERAFELARAGQCRTIEDIRRKLSAERYEGVDMHLGGNAIRRQLKAAMDASAGGGAGALAE